MGDLWKEFVDPADIAFQALQTLPSGDSNPDSFGAAFSGDSENGAYGTGFGPGDYSGGYTGEGDTIYWGAWDPPRQPALPGGAFNPVHFSPAMAVIKAGAGVSQANDDILRRLAAAQEEAPSSTGDTSLAVSSERSIVIAPPATEASGYNIESTASTIEDEKRSEAFGGTEEEESTQSWLGTVEDRSGGGGSFREPMGKGGVYKSPSHVSDPETFGGESGTSESSVFSSEPEFVTKGFGMAGRYEGGQPHIPGYQDPDIEMGQMGGTPGDGTEVSSVYDGDSYTGTETTTEAGGVTINTDLGASLEMGEMGGGGGVTPGGPGETIAVDIGGGARGISAPTGLPEIPAFEPFMLQDIAPSMPFELGNLGVGETGYIPSGMSDFMGDIGNIAVNSGGMTMNAGALFNFAQARIVDFGVGMALMPFFNWVNAQTGNSWTSRTVQLGLATMGLALAGDPFGLIVAPIGWMIQDFIAARQRVLENDDPESIKGKKWGYVREGTRWYPAVSESSSPDEGFDANTSDLTLKYGDKLKWEQEKGTGNWYPTFDNVRYKTFKVDDDQIYGYKAENEYRERKDPLRDFYFMSDEDASELLKNFAGGGQLAGHVNGDNDFTAEEQAAYQAAQTQAFSTFKQHEDRTWKESWRPQSEGGNARYIDDSWDTEVQAYGKNFAPLADSMQDSRAALDFIHDWRHSSKGKVKADHGDFWTGSIKLRRVINEQGSIATDQYAAAPRFQKRKNINRAIYNDMPEVMQYYGGPERDRYLRNKGLSRNTDNTLGEQSWFVGQAENDLYLETFKQSMKELYTAQKSAALSMGFKDKYKFEPLETRNITSNYVHGTDRGYEDYMNTAGAIEDKYGYEDFRFLNMVKTNGWYHLYTDNSWEIPELRTAQDLHAELLDIEEAGDAQYAGTEHYRNTQQRQYLSTKAITRYWAQKIDGLGGGPQLLDAMQTAEKQEYSPETPHSKAHYPINGPPAFWQPGDDLNDEHGMGLGWHYGSDPGVQDGPADPELSQAREDTDRLERERAMELYQAWGIAGDGANDPDFIAGRFGGDFMKYWEATGRDAPYEDGVQQVWDQGKMEWVAPEEPEEAKGPEYTGPELDMLKQEWEQGGAFADVPIPGADFPEREGWHYSQLENVIVAPDGTKFSPVGDNTRIFLHEQELLDAAAAAEQKKAEDEAAAEQEKAAHEAATEQQKAEDEQKAADEQKKTDDAQKAADEQKAAEDAAKAAEDAAAAQKVIDDAAAAKKAAEDAAAQADEDTAAAEDTDQDTPGPVYTFHHGEQFHFHHDTTVPLHIPGTSKTQSAEVSKTAVDFDPEEDEMGSADAWIGGHIDG